MTTTTSSIGGAVKTILASKATSGASPEEILQKLNSYGIEWYITEQGDLMIKYWQVGAEDFVSPEQVGTIQKQAPPAEATSLEWVSAHLPELRQHYGGRWVAIAGNAVAASAPTLPQLLDKINQLGIERPFVTEIPVGPITWMTTFASPFV